MRWAGFALLALLGTAVEVVSALFLVLLLTASTEDEEQLELLGLLVDVGTKSQFVAFAIAVAVIYLVRGAFLVAQLAVQNVLAHGEGVRVSKRMFGGYLSASYEDHLSQQQSQVVRNTYETVTVWANSVLVPAVTIAAESCVLLAMAGLLAFTQPMALVGAIVFFAPVVGLLSRLVRTRLHRLGSEIQDASAGTLHVLQQSLTGFREVRIAGEEASALHRFADKRQAYARARARGQVLADVPRPVLESSLVMFLAAMLVIRFGSSSGDSAQAGISGGVASLGLFGYAAVRALPSLSRIAKSIGQLRLGAAATEDIYSELQRLETNGAAVTRRWSDDSIREHESSPTSLHVRDVGYAYPAGHDLVLDGVNLNFDLAEWTAIIGPSGGGKSTLIDLVAGLLPPTTGSVTAGVLDAFEDFSCWKDRIGIVSQDSFLLDDTVRANITFGSTSSGESVEEDSRIWAALAACHLDGYVRSLPKGLDTLLGAAGQRLSGGQRQRLCIARALHRRPHLLLLDEATSALDRDTEREVMSGLAARRGEMGVISVTHRLSTMEYFDRVVVLAAGQVVLDTSMDDLVVKDLEKYLGVIIGEKPASDTH